MQAARSPLPPSWARDIQLDEGNTHWLQSLPSSTQAFAATWLLQHLITTQASLQAPPTPLQPNPQPAANSCNPTPASGESNHPTRPQAHQYLHPVPSELSIELGPGGPARGYPFGVECGGAAARGASDGLGGPASGYPLDMERGGAAMGGVQPAASGPSDGLVGAESGPSFDQAWQTWHEDMELWAESCCPVAEAVMSIAHAIAQSMPDPEAGSSHCNLAHVGLSVDVNLKLVEAWLVQQRAWD